MYEYFKDNYAWNLAVVTFVEAVGTLTEPMEAFATVSRLAEADLREANEAWFQAMYKLGGKLERLADSDIAADPLNAPRKYHRASAYFIRAERMIAHLRNGMRLVAFPPQSYIRDGVSSDDPRFRSASAPKDTLFYKSKSNRERSEVPDDAPSAVGRNFKDFTIKDYCHVYLLSGYEIGRSGTQVRKLTQCLWGGACNSTCWYGIAREAC